jgi:hypothetical protein
LSGVDKGNMWIENQIFKRQNNVLAIVHGLIRGLFLK